MIANTPLTSATLGSTRCVGCEKRFTDTPRPTVDVETNEQNRNRYGGLSGPQGTRLVIRRWHADCLADFEAQNDANRQRAAADNEAMLRAMCEAAGLDYEAVKAEHDRRQAEATS